MKRMSKIGLVLAASAAALLATGCSTLCGGADDTVKCSGVNSCKGSGSCSTPDSSCKGKKGGKGWVSMSRDECIRRGGEVME